jgi:hypothetical protein
MRAVKSCNFLIAGRGRHRYDDGRARGLIRSKSNGIAFPLDAGPALSTRHPGLVMEFRALVGMRWNTKERLQAVLQTVA